MKSPMIFFPFDSLRKEQDKLIEVIQESLESKGNLICHAPTGLGKTAAVLGPALARAMDEKLHILFLTSRTTQHKIVIDTLKRIKDKFSLDFSAVSLVGKKSMCAQGGVSSLFSSEFFEFCKKMREEKKCEFYSNLKGTKLTTEAKKLLEETLPRMPLPHDSIMDACSEKRICPYYFSIELAARSRVIIGDYNYLFNRKIQENIFSKTGIEIEKCIAVIDEAHNLNSRLKDLASDILSSSIIRRAISEAKKYGYTDQIGIMQDIQDLLLQLSDGIRDGSERLISREEFFRPLSVMHDYEQTIGDLEAAGEAIRESQKQSYVGSIARFLQSWKLQDEGFARIISLKKGLREQIILLSYRCLDPSILCRQVINSTYSSILISGTLQPTSMHRQMLGIERCKESVFSDPFPKENRLNLIIPKTSTKYTSRSPEQYREIARVCAEIVNTVPGNTALFFPSYTLLGSVEKYFTQEACKTIYREDVRMTKSERAMLLEDFQSNCKAGGALLAVASGSFGEGIDLPGDLLKAVVVVGLPLTPPDLETKSLINYFDKKFGKGWDYGYLFPAFNKCLQSAGRCIRSETDRGLIVFLDERFIWKNYYRCFPKDWKIQVSTDYLPLIKSFFGVFP